MNKPYWVELYRKTLLSDTMWTYPFAWLAMSLLTLSIFYGDGFYLFCFVLEYSVFIGLIDRALTSKLRLEREIDRALHTNY